MIFYKTYHRSLLAEQVTTTEEDGIANILLITILEREMMC